MFLMNKNNQTWPQISSDQPRKEESPLDGLTELEGASLRQHFECFPRSLRSLTNLGARSERFSMMFDDFPSNLPEIGSN